MKVGSRGFTLIELLIVLTIIAVLATIGMTQFLRHRRSTFNAAAISDLKNAQMALESYYSDNFSYPPE